MSVDFWNERYAQENYIYGTEPNDFLKESFKFMPAKGKILCLAEGEGRNALFLLQNDYTVQAIDQSPAGKEKAVQLASQYGFSLDYTLTDLNDFVFGEEQWDGILYVFAHTPSDIRQKVFQNSFNALKKDGVFMLEAYHPKQLEYQTGGPKEESWLVTLEDLKQTFPQHGIIHEAELERNIQEGQYHTGLSFVTQFIWKK